MSVLTKIFVVALVILSLLLSAATITFVNSVDDYKREMAATKVAMQNNDATAKADAAKAAAAAEAMQGQLGVANTANKSLNDQIGQLQKQVADLGVQLARANSAATASEANVNKLTAAVGASEATKALFAQQITDLRATNEKLQTQNGDLNVAFTNASNKFDVTEAARRQLAEKLQESQTTGEKLSASLRDRGVDPTRITSSGLAAGAPALNGIIRETRDIAGIPHATISLGSEDAVKVGMEFNILDKTSGKFLGKLTVVAVEPNEAIGRLTGPDVTSVAAGSEVRTQL